MRCAATFALLALASTTLASHISPDRRAAVQHKRLATNTSDLAVRAAGDVSRRGYSGVEFTWYTDTEYACGDNPGGYIVALSPEDFAGGAHCYKPITISYGGKTETATVIDECAGCEPGHIDLSPNLFQNFGTLGEGTVYGSWSFGGSAEPAKKPSPSPSTYPSSTPSPTPTPKPKPSSSSSSTAEKPTSSGPPSSIHSSATSTASATATASSSAVPTSSAVFDPSIATQGGEVDGADTGALYGLNLAIVQIGAMLDSAHGA